MRIYYQLIHYQVSKLKLGTVINKSQQKIKVTMIDIFCKFYVQKNDVAYRKCITLVEAIIRHRKLQRFVKITMFHHFHHLKIRKLLTSEVDYAVNRYECFIENKNIRTLIQNSQKGNIEPHQNFTGCIIKKHGGSGLTPIHIEYRK